jgi:hypothetical protein
MPARALVDTARTSSLVQEATSAMSIRKTLPALSLFLLAACGSNAVGSSSHETTSTQALAEGLGGDDDVDVRHVLLVSVDGLHETDVALFIAAHPESTLAALAGTGVRYSDAHTSTPSDSFPGLLALVTGGTPKSTGVYYDDSYDRTLYAPGSACQGAPGTEVVLDESVEHDDSQLFSPIDPGNLPLAKDRDGGCRPVYPHDFIRANTVFEVIRAAGGHTAWSDKHPAYDLVNGPSGKGVEDLYTPEVNSLIKNGGTANGVNLAATLALCDGKTNSLPLAKVGDYTTCEPAIMAYDDVKVQAVINEIDGRTSDGSRAARVPAIFGMNFQQVSVAEKLPVGGYADAAGTPSALLAGALAHVDASLGRMVSELRARRLLERTLIVVSAKHGQSPIDRARLAMEPGGRGDATVTDPLGYINAVDKNVDAVFAPFVNPNSGGSPAVNGHLQTDDVGIVWLQDQSRANVAGVVAQLEDPAHRAAMFADTLPAGTVFSTNVVAGDELADLFGDPTSGDPVAAARAPNVFIQPNAGVIYSGSSKKIAEHGGGTVDDTNVALLVSNPRLRGRVIDRPVRTTQVAPTILRVLGLDADALDAVRREGTRPLPGLRLE